MIRGEKRRIPSFSPESLPDYSPPPRIEPPEAAIAEQLRLMIMDRQSPQIENQEAPRGRSPPRRAPDPKKSSHPRAAAILKKVKGPSDVVVATGTVQIHQAHNNKRRGPRKPAAAVTATPVMSKDDDDVENIEKTLFDDKSRSRCVSKIPDRSFRKRRKVF